MVGYSTQGPPGVWHSVWEMLNPYIKNTQVWFCPSQSGTNVGMGANIQHLIIDLNWGAAPIAMATITMPAERLLFCDGQNGASSSGKEGSDGNPVVWCPGNHPGYPPSWNDVYQQGISSRHNNGANCVFADGHAKWKGRQALLANESDMFGHSGL